jgi:5-methylcytosine-specific restriction endonuclease McrA
MADINSPVTYTKPVVAFLKNKLEDTTFTHKNWSEDDLQDYRRLIREYYRTVQNGSCAFCKAPVSLRSAANCHIEHIVPKSKRREFIFEPKNLCVICADCNEIKRSQETEATIPDTLTNGGKAKLYPRSSKAFLIVHPHFDVWDDHVIKFGKLYVDLSDKGAFTIGACVLNRELRKFGWEVVVTDEAALRDAATKWLNAKDNITAARFLQVMKRLLVTV